MCLIYQTPAPCEHSFCNQSTVVASTDGSFCGVYGIAGLLAMQAQGLKQLVQQGNTICSLLTRLSHSSQLEKLQKPLSPPSDPWDVFGSKCESALFCLWLSVPPVSPIMRESGFSLSGCVRNLEGHISNSHGGVTLSVGLYTTETPARQLSVNITGKTYEGKKALRGTLTTFVAADGNFVFPRIVVNEVSSHYLDDEFTLVITAADEKIKPLAFRHLVVKARKKQRKASKTEATAVE